MRISVIVPTRNRANLLARCVEQIRAQTHPDIELIVVDDGSGPEQAGLNADVVQRGAGRYILLQPTDSRGSGPSAVRNAGIGAASADVIAFCDDDDYWCDPDYLSTAAATFTAQPELGLLFANQEAVSVDNSRRKTWQPHFEAVLATRDLGGADVVPVSKSDCLVAPGDFAHLNICVLRRSVVDAIGGFDDTIRYAEDMDFVVRAADRASAIAYLRRTVAIHNVPDRKRQDNASTQMNALARQLALQQVATRLFAQCQGTEARDYARRLGANACRALARDAAGSARFDEALDWARRGGAWQQTLRWLAYTQLLRLRTLTSGR